MNNHPIKRMIFSLILLTSFSPLPGLQNNAHASLTDEELIEYEKLVRAQLQVLEKYRITQHELDVFGLKEVANNQGLSENETKVLENKMLYDYKKDAIESTLCGDRLFETYEKLLSCILFTGK